MTLRLSGETWRSLRFSTEALTVPPIDPTSRSNNDPAVTPVNKGGRPGVTRDRVANAIDLSTTRIGRAPSARELRTALGEANTNHESAHGHVVEKPSSLESRHIKHPRRKLISIIERHRNTVTDDVCLDHRLTIGYRRDHQRGTIAEIC